MVVVAAVVVVVVATGVAAVAAAVAEAEPFVAVAVESSAVGQLDLGIAPCYLQYWEKGHASSDQASLQLESCFQKPAYCLAFD